MKTQKCMNEQCLRQIPMGHVMCAYHWQGVPGEVKKQVLHRMKGWKSMGAARQYLYDWMQQHKRKGAAA